MRAMGEAALDCVVRHLSALEQAPSHGLDDAGAVAARLRTGIPEQGAPLADLLATFMEAVPRSLNTAGPGYMAYIPGGGLYASAVADFLACGVNRYVGIWGAAPALVQLEANVVRWLAELMGYGPQAMGVLTSGGSMANFAAVVTARVARLGERFQDGVLYTTAQAHHSVAKAAHLAGFPRSAVRIVPTDAGLRMDVAALEAAILADRAAGARPFMIVANAGTTNTGAVDPLEALANLAAAEDLWLHVDGAYGGFFRLTARGAAVLRGMERADSITLDPHKGLFLPYGTGCILVREGALLEAAHSADAHYLQDLGGEAAINFTDYSAELSRDFRGLRVWLPMKLHGLAAFREALDEKLDLARHAWERLHAAPGFEVVAEPALSIVAFRYRPPQGDANEFNRRLMDRVNHERRVFLSSTLLDGQYTLRICVLSFRTHRTHVDAAVDALLRNAAELA